ncbi:MAG: hypothetical protein AAGB48_07250 [Planctomycetota bacterium]
MRSVSIGIVLLAVFISSRPISPAAAQTDAQRDFTELIDPDRPTSGWTAIAADGVTISVREDADVPGALRIDYDFSAGSGFGIVRKPVTIPLGENYRFAYRVRGHGPANDLEFKLIDPSDENVWWVNRRAFRVPSDWTQMLDRRRHFEFAWGPSGGAPLDALGFIEFAIAASEGGTGTVYIDRLDYRSLPPETPYTGVPMLRDPAMDAPARPAPDGEAGWRFEAGASSLVIDFGRGRPVTGLELEWTATGGVDLRVGAQTETGFVDGIGGINASDGGMDTVLLPETEATALRLDVRSDTTATLERFRVLTPEEGTSVNDLLVRIAHQRGEGLLPRPFSQQQTLWTVVGTPGHRAESLISELGSVEIDKGGFSIEPVLFVGDRLLTWADGTHEQSLLEGSLPLPTVRRTHPGITLEVAPVVEGDDTEAVLAVRYRLKNTGESRWGGRLGLAVLPVQVLPPWQWLNLVGGHSPVTRIELASSGAVINGDREISLITPADSVAAWDLQSSLIPIAFDRGSASCESIGGTASGLLVFRVDLAPGEQRDVVLAADLPGSAGSLPDISNLDYGSMRRRVASEWREELAGIRIRLPGRDAAIADAIRSTAAYVLINRDGPAIQPGSRTYERAWIRDGSITGAAMLTLGFNESMRRYIEWYAPYQYESGKVPCVVDHRGPDPVDEHDSTGQLIFAIARYIETSGNTGFASSHFETVARGVVYLEDLIAQRSTPEYAGTAYEGLVPESISHEGYSAKPMHSYWDNFFVLQGLRDAAWLASLAGKPDEAARWTETGSTFAESLHDSIIAAAREQGVPYIPGCVELGDFDPTSTAVALAPLSVSDALPADLLEATLERYWEWFEARRLGSREYRDYTPYEMRVIGAMGVFGKRDRVATMLDWFMEERQPVGWNQWTEIVYQDPNYPGFIGDVPHTWCGSNLINSLSALVVSSGEGEIRLARGVPERWFRAEEGFAIEGLATPYGRLDMTYQKSGSTGSFTIDFVPSARWSGAPVVLHLPSSVFGDESVVLNGLAVPGRIHTDPSHSVFRFLGPEAPADR